MDQRSRLWFIQESGRWDPIGGSSEVQRRSGNMQTSKNSSLHAQEKPIPVLRKTSRYIRTLANKGSYNAKKQNGSLKQKQTTKEEFRNVAWLLKHDARKTKAHLELVLVEGHQGQHEELQPPH